MNTSPSQLLRVLVLPCVLAFASLSVAQEPAGLLDDPVKAAVAAAGISSPNQSGLLLPGVSLAEGISEITGVAVSPLLGVSVVGAWTWWRTEESLRGRLPWYCDPRVWGAGLGLIALCLMKDVLGAFVPALAKKPLDWVELFENKASALVASAGFVPLVALAMSQVDRIQRDAGAVSGTAMLPVASMLDAGVHTPWISIPVAVAAFGVVWLSSHAINVLIAFSPFGLVDTGLKLLKLGILALVAGSAALSPVLGAAVSLVLIAIAVLMAGWSLRLAVFGMLMGRDMILDPHADRESIRSDGAKGFLARRIDGVPVRTLGRVETDELGRTRFSWRSWFFGMRRSIPLEESGLVLCKGVVSPTLAMREEGMRPRGLVTLLPRYRGCEAALAEQFGVHEVLDNALVRGFKAARQWVGDVLAQGMSRMNESVVMRA